MARRSRGGGVWVLKLVDFSPRHILYLSSPHQLSNCSPTMADPNPKANRIKARLASERIRSMLDPASLDSQGAVNIAIKTMENLIFDALLDAEEFISTLGQVPYLLEFILVGKRTCSLNLPSVSDSHSLGQLQHKTDSPFSLNHSCAPCRPTS